MKIVEKKILADEQGVRVTSMVISAPLIAGKALPGQFVVLIVNETGERIPLTVVDKDADRGTITIIFQELGFSTKLLGTLDVGHDLFALAGPLGHATATKEYGNIIIVGGGVGIAEIYPVARALKEANNHVTAVLGARTHTLLILEDEMKQAVNKLQICTDDGSYGKKGFVTDALKDLLSRSPIPCSLVYAVGPIPMMKAVADLTQQYGTKTIVSLNALMVDATGMCGCCRVTVGGEVKFSCIDGPEFDAHSVDWEELIKRNRIYEKQEKHICKINNLL